MATMATITTIATITTAPTNVQYCRQLFTVRAVAFTIVHSRQRLHQCLPSSPDSRRHDPTHARRHRRGKGGGGIHHPVVHFPVSVVLVVDEKRRGPHFRPPVRESEAGHPAVAHRRGEVKVLVLECHERRRGD
jgi:hypothetical protein